MPGFTHLQSAQPVTLGHHLMAYREMFARDRSRFADARGAAQRMPARRRGAGRHQLPDRPRERPPRRSASTGPPPTASTPCPTAISSSIISTRRRSARSICRGWPRRSSCGRRSRSASCTCPMPGRPDRRSCPTSAIPTPPSWSAAIRRGSSATWCRCWCILKGLPLAYAKDLQDDKAPLFDAHDLLIVSLRAMAGMLARAAVQPGPDARRRRSRPFDGDRPRRLAGREGRCSVPRGAWDRRAGRGGGRRRRQRPQRPQPRRNCRRSIRASAPKRSIACRSTSRFGRAASAGGTAPERVVEAIAAARAARRSRE